MHAPERALRAVEGLCEPVDGVLERSQNVESAQHGSAVTRTFAAQK
jgi:hypothetical protein